MTEEWDLKAAEWRGYVARALEDAAKEFADGKKCQQIIEDDIKTLNNRITNLEIKVAGIATVVTLVVSIVMKLIMG